MAITISGTTGIAGVDGSAGTPAVQGTDTNTGVFYPAADTVGVSTGGSERVRVNSSGNVGIGTSSPSSSYIAKFLQVDNATSSGVVLNATRKFSIYSSSSSTLSFLDETAGAERMRIDSSGNLLFNSGYGSVATAYGCRAWVNFNGAATPITINASGNVSTIGDIGVGIYQINFSSAMPDANYAVCSIGARSTTSTTNNVSTLVVEGTYTTLSVQVFNERSNDGAQVDAQQSVMVVR